MFTGGKKVCYLPSNFKIAHFTSVIETLWNRDIFTSGYCAIRISYWPEPILLSHQTPRLLRFAVSFTWERRALALFEMSENGFPEWNTRGPTNNNGWLPRCVSLLLMSLLNLLHQKGRFAAALLWSAKPCGCACLFTVTSSPTFVCTHCSGLLLWYATAPQTTGLACKQQRFGGFFCAHVNARAKDVSSEPQFFF